MQELLTPINPGRILVKVQEPSEVLCGRAPLHNVLPSLAVFL